MEQKKKFTALMLALPVTITCLLLSILAAEVSADMYKYTDDSGAICMTNSRDAVPKRYRASMQVIREESSAPKKLLPEVKKKNSDPLPQPVTETRAAPQSAPMPLTAPVDNKNRYMRTALLVGSMVAAYFILGRVAGVLGVPKVGTLLFLLIILVGCVYMYGLYIKEMSSVFGTLRKDALNIKKNVESREQKSDQLLKQMNEKELLKEPQQEHVKERQQEQD